MPRFRPEFVQGRVLAVAALATMSACHVAGLVGGEMRNHPPALVGEWVDSAKTTPADSAIWVLGASGDDASMHLLRDDDAPDAAAARGTIRRYGYWYLQGTLADTLGRAICFTKRPGRSAPTCIAFELDTVTVADGARRRLRLRGYQGERSRSDRVLIAREP